MIRFALLSIVSGCATDSTHNDSVETKVLLIGIDGIRPDVLAEVHTPTLDSLAAHGTFTAHAQTGYPSVSGPGWSSFLTGVWSDKHGVTNNEFEGKNYEAYPDIFTRIEQVAPELETFVVADWLPLVTDDHNGPVISDQVDTKRIFDGYELGWLEADEESVRAAEHALATGNPDAMFVYLGNPDETSHHFESIGAEYRSAIETADHHVERLIRAIVHRPSFGNEDWLILVSTDHGRRADGGHGGDTDEERTIFYIASGPSATVGLAPDTTYIVDLPVTALEHLGVEIDPSWGLDGKVVGLRSN
jgi:predicted AlkP superfamily pyrophosphatase or phosphodiesterase